VITLTVHEATAGYGQAPVIHGVDLTCSRGEITVLIGPNGAGKSTLLKAIAGLVPLLSGRVTVGDTDVSAMTAEKRVRCGLTLVPQTDDVFPTLTVAENVEMRAYLQRPKRADLARRVQEVLDLFPDLVDARKRKAGTLSGGQRKLLSVAGSLAAKPTVLMLDEPTAGLAPVYASQLWAQIHLIASQGITVLVVEQNVTEALSHANVVCVLVAGRVALSGAADAMSDQDLSGIFLGRKTSL
jgi:branched-chain amino acid transport system ATP-binding protein